LLYVLPEWQNQQNIATAALVQPGDEGRAYGRETPCWQRILAMLRRTITIASFHATLGAESEFEWGISMTRLTRSRAQARAKALAVQPKSTAWWLAASALALASLMFVVFAAKAKAGASYDGAWKVVIITQSGNCDPAYSYPVRVSGGRVSYAGDGSFDISGNVSESGGVNVTIARGDQKASGSGRLTASSGSGSWSGKSASTACSGRWEASRSS
jgi:hypothetical protein